VGRFVDSVMSPCPGPRSSVADFSTTLDARGSVKRVGCQLGVAAQAHSPWKIHAFCTVWLLDARIVDDASCAEAANCARPNCRRGLIESS
jgi:hypothetical protein